MTKRLLIIDDEEDIRDVVKAALEEFASWDVTTIDSGVKAIQILRTGDYDAILLDLSMPDLDGFSVYELLQADPIAQNIPIALLTAKVLPSDRRRFAELNIAGVISKPFNPITIWCEISDIFGWEV
jgi:CheY-like chemotaxis protein